jgi:hypothetical protein
LTDTVRKGEAFGLLKASLQRHACVDGNRLKIFQVIIDELEPFIRIIVAVEVD